MKWSLDRSHPNFHRFIWSTFFYAFQYEERKESCYFYILWKIKKCCWASTGLNRHWICLLEAKWISFELNPRNAVNDICHIKDFNSLKILHFEYLAAIIGIKHNNNNNNYNDNKCKWMNNHQNYCPFNRLNVTWKNIYLLPC